MPTKNIKLQEQIDRIFRVIGSPFGTNTDLEMPTKKQIDELFDISFDNRVGLLFLQCCIDRGAELSEVGQENYKALDARRNATEDILVKLTSILDEVHRDGWVLFKTIKPFPSTPNDTDWFPFELSDHAWLCEHLLKSGFSFLEKAPLQTTLIDDSGVGMADSDKRGGVWYIDCYRAPGADYFIYLDPRKMKKYFTRIEVKGKMLPALSAPAELLAICYHNVFPERTYSVETFYLILHYLKEIEEKDLLDEFYDATKENFVRRAVSANLAVTREIHKHYFGTVPAVLDKVLDAFDSELGEGDAICDQGFALPYNFGNKCFMRCFFEKLKDPVSAKSLLVQIMHMLNPIFCYGVFKILYHRMLPGGIYKQM